MGGTHTLQLCPLLPLHSDTTFFPLISVPCRAATLAVLAVLCAAFLAVREVPHGSRKRPSLLLTASKAVSTWAPGVTSLAIFCAMGVSSPQAGDAP